MRKRSGSSSASVSSPRIVIIISGGQTGVDRAALDVAAKLGLKSGGWCPRGRLAEDGPLHPDYPLRETLAETPEQRTVWNTFDSDATLIIAPREGALQGGSRLALQTAKQYGRPALVAAPEGLEEAASWLDSLSGVRLLNIAGPRASEWHGAYPAATAFLTALLEGRVRDPVSLPRVLITGGSGFLARHLVEAAPSGWEVYVTTRRGGGGAAGAAAELSDPAEVGSLFASVQPSVVIHTAYGARYGDRDIVAATRHVASAARGVGARLIHISSDMVLDGESAPFEESAEPAPVHEYGRWKSSAEALAREAGTATSIVRISLLTRFSPPDPRTEWVLSGLRGEVKCELFTDELRTPTLVEDAARQVWEIVGLGGTAEGVWHLANPEAVSRYALGCLVAAAYDLDPRLLVASSLQQSRAVRPRDLRLLTARADRRLPTRSRTLSELVSECRAQTRSNFN